ncbi:MAG: TonB-dependent receptor domain-containing protein, partial [Bryobacteraceae bacterium]
GAAAGGAAAPDRTFWFASFDSLRERRGLARLAAVPGAAERSGDFSAGGRIIVDPFTRQPLPGNRVPSSRIAPLSARVLALFPLPNRDAGAANFLAQPVLRESLSQFHGRLDHRLTSADRITLRYSLGDQDLGEPYTEELAATPGFGDEVSNRGHNAMVHHTRALGARTLHSLRIGFSRGFRGVRPENHRVDVGRLWGVDWLDVRPRDFGYPLVNVAGYSAAGDAAQLPLERTVNTGQIVESLSLVRGRHAVKLGGEVRHQRLAGFLDYFARGSLSFSGALSNTGLSDLLLGFPSFGLQATFDNRQALRATAYSLYAQDDWKIRPNLTVNLGLRYEYNTPPVDPSDRMAALVPSTGRIVNVGTGGVSRSGLRNDGNNFAPRAGIVWAPEPGTAVRAGYGVYYDASMLVVNSSLYFNPPYFNVRIFFPTATSLLTLANPFPRQGGITPAPSPNTLSPDLTTSYLQHWSFSAERQIGRATTASVAYAGSKGTHLIRSRDLNQPPPAPGP